MFIRFHEKNIIWQLEMSEILSKINSFLFFIGALLMTSINSTNASHSMQSTETSPCLFCDIVQGKAPSHKIWESATHLAFLTIFPNTKGATVVVPKKHVGSYAFKGEDEDLSNLVLAAKEVALLLDNKLGAGRTAMVLEGFGIDHLHAKLYPLHGTPLEGPWEPIKSTGTIKDKYFDTYEGYISSHDSHKADDQELAKLAEKIRSHKL